MPTLILLIVMNIFPLFYSMYLSFNDYSVIGNDPPKWVGLENYQKILTNERQRYWHNFTLTGRYAVLTVGLQIIVGFSLAMLLREKFKGSGLITTLILIPMMLSPVVVGLFWKLIFDPSKGIFNYLIYTESHQQPPMAGRSDSLPVGDYHRRRVDVESLCHAAVSVGLERHSRLSV